MSVAHVQPVPDFAREVFASPSGIDATGMESEFLEVISVGAHCAAIALIVTRKRRLAQRTHLCVALDK
jgi:hypothetical protein